MSLSLKNTVFALAATFVFAAATHAQTSTTTTFSSSSSSSSSSSFGIRPDGTTFSTGHQSSSSETNASTTTSQAGLFGVTTNTTSLNQSQSQSSGFSQSSGPGGFHQDAYSSNSGSTSLVNSQHSNGLLGNVSDVQTFNSEFSNFNSVSQGIGPGGIYDNRYQRNTGSATIGRTINANSIFGPGIQTGSTRTVGFSNEQGISTGLNSGGFFQDAFNNQNITTSGTDFFNLLP